MSKENLEMTNATRKLTERERQWNAHGETALAKAWRGEGAWHFINPLLAGKRQKKNVQLQDMPRHVCAMFAKRHRLLMKRRGVGQDLPWQYRPSSK